jgi:acetoacetate decarboxylase
MVKGKRGRIGLRLLARGEIAHVDVASGGDQKGAVGADSEGVFAFVRMSLLTITHSNDEKAVAVVVGERSSLRGGIVVLADDGLSFSGGYARDAEGCRVISVRFRGSTGSKLPVP